MVEKYKNWLNRIIKLFLFALATLIIVYMARDLVEIFNVIIMPNSERSLGIISDYILAFFMLFEFIVMIIKYIEDTHNIPIKYLVIISITAILRQLLVVHNDAVQTIILTLAILILTIVLYVIELIKKKEIERKKNK
ncbi:phosphate-starvation-inducible PsiE family protein [Vagococcus carniphilus]|uniref:Protein PsiE n=1 Tax=Vagococcus carniphilus TaxID=218144 RepID=A0AAW8UBH2_9ENTE|nr:phosphate-starvation-inducible PsiE family protein [Vagococcus carniphilus]MDT2814675.1 phosphate-starvation-inducible PsiE family protein [Vagococcus carniphilus]MDT2831995.1 phosphate-starvation-inducible PsiE family protein [Vagococcus carniphilus]MDT2834602.1 phosphate-starvation-inducible PsiE family protein [Vagococcus carniphilus]MDT2840864.1 phosphate-starvation-inducible PsiE family protein [Vagococcus carniphilus]MDT2848402.1 phosphate-starvation-inducible PsiE family protein [Vag